jgi:lipopolysaccharide transport system ATP-binding protein
MSQISIKVENLSKAYQIGEIGTGTISHDLERWFAKIRGKEDPFLKIGEKNDRSKKGESNIVWSLKDINFEINKGDAVGIIGRNGAGKSTLLKILSKVTAPTTGKILGNGRIASLLEVGTGFHPELTGRENIFLNGAILGMKKKEISQKFDEIVDFSGVERYIDTPVKRYSSGMYVRLAFAVAAHLQSEILIVDEVLAVGDAEFQKKCLGKMGQVSKGEGRTVLFVSHNMAAVTNLCDNSILLNNGKVEYIGEIANSIKIYHNENYPTFFSNELKDVFNQIVDDTFELIDLKISQDDNNNDEFINNKDIIIEYCYKIKKRVIGLRIGFDFIDKKTDITLFRTFHDDFHEKSEYMEVGVYKSNLILKKDFFNNGIYLLSLSIGIHNVRWITFDKIKTEIKISNIIVLNKSYSDLRPGVIIPKLVWNTVVIK